MVVKMVVKSAEGPAGITKSFRFQVNRRWQLLLFLGFVGHAVLLASGASTARIPRRLEQHKAYLPPFTAPNFGEKEENSLSSYDTPTTQDAATFQTTPQVGSLKAAGQRGAGSGGRKFFTSYAPAPSGLAANTFQFSAPQPSQPIPLPSLIPASVRDQLSATADRQQAFVTVPLPLTTLTTLPGTPAVATTTEAVPSATEVLALDRATPAQLLTATQNRTIEAARLLASTLLEASGEQPLEPLNGVQVVDPAHLADPGRPLNSTDVVIVKSQKHAYIIPMQLARDGSTPLGLRELYNMRDQLPKAYTVNQFIFIIKPEKINFLNKLV